MKILELIGSEQVERDATPDEIAEIEARKNAKPSEASYIAAVQDMLDTEARRKNYDNILSACSYAGAPNPFQAEAVSFVQWRGDCWSRCYAILADVQASRRTQPTVAELVAELPACPVV